MNHARPYSHATRGRSGRTASRAHAYIRSEAGFTIYELIVAMVILAVIMSLVVPSFLGARQESNVNLVRTQAVTYSVAIEEFQRAHANRAPELGVAADWPDPERGPIDKLGRPLRASDGDVSKRLLISASVPGSIPDGYAGALQYERPTATEWRLRVYAKVGNETKEICQMGSGSEGAAC